MSKTVYTINNVKKLIDLNGDLVNFDIYFKVTSKNREPFELLVVDQATLDNNPNIEYKIVQDGEISGNVKNDKGVFQNYFLILKAELEECFEHCEECECEIEILRKELPKFEPPSPPKKIKKETDWTKVILVIGGIAAIIYLVYWLNLDRPNSPNQKSTLEGEKQSRTIQTTTEPTGFANSKFYTPPQQGLTSFGYSHRTTANPRILEKLKKMDL